MNLLLMNGYGFFVWFSFGIVIISCLVVYLKTRKTLKKYEKEFLMEIETLSASEKERIIIWIQVLRGKGHLDKAASTCSQPGVLAITWFSCSPYRIVRLSVL